VPLIRLKLLLLLQKRLLPAPPQQPLLLLALLLVLARVAAGVPSRTEPVRWPCPLSQGSAASGPPLGTALHP
jgi:hypothetical protein